MNLDALVAPLRADVVSGATVVARTAAEVLRRAAVRLPADDAEGLRSTLATLALKILDAQPSMAPLVALATRVLVATGQARSLEDARRAAAHAAEAFREGLDGWTHAVGRRAARQLPEEGTVLTLSASSTVRATLLEAGRESRIRVFCLEGRPMNEGRSLAEALAREGMDVALAVDAAAGSLLPEADVVLLGADSVGDRGVVNKIGSRVLARGARERGIPVLVTADRTKLLPPGFPQVTEDDRPGEEVWNAPAGVRIWNRYFEVVSLEDVSALVTESATLDPDRVVKARSRMEVPPELAAWAERLTDPRRPTGQEPPPS